MLKKIFQKLCADSLLLQKLSDRIDGIEREQNEWCSLLNRKFDDIYVLNRKIDDIYVLNKKIDELNASMELVKYHTTSHPLYLSQEQEFLLNMFYRIDPTESIPTDINKFVLLNYRSHLPVFSVTNLGDYVQTIAVRKALEKIYKNEKLEFDYFDRDSLSFYENASMKRERVVMQGWFSHSYSFLPSKFLSPVYVGTHFDLQARIFIEKMLSIKPDLFKSSEIGCRDYSTLSFCKKHHIAAYYSRCLTLTLPKRALMDTQKKVFLVNIPEDWEKFIPENLRKNAVSVNQKKILQGSEAWWELYGNAEALLEQYRSQASLVITTALHCASPCLAMGIPVVLLADNPEENLVRFSALDGLIEVKTLKDLEQGKVNFNPQVPDIELLKQAMLTNLRYELNRQVGLKNDDINIDEVRTLIRSFRCT